MFGNVTAVAEVDAVKELSALASSLPSSLAPSGPSTCTTGRLNVSSIYIMFVKNTWPPVFYHRATDRKAGRQTGVGGHVFS